MVRTLDPNKVLDSFLQRTKTSYERYGALYESLDNDEDALTLRRGLATDLVFRLGCDWESFQHEWFIAAISKRPLKFRANVTAVVAEKLRKADVASTLETLRPGSTVLPATLSAEQIEALADPQGYNVTFKDSAVWADKSSIDLDPQFAQKVRDIAFDVEATCVLELLKALRNNIAHGSTRSLDDLNDKARMRAGGGDVGMVGSCNNFLVRDGGGQIRSAGVYLHAGVEGGRRRATGLVGRVEDIAERLRY